jgi:hypothetical protein
MSEQLGADDAMAAEELFFAAEHVHGAALAFGIAAPPAGQFRHHSLGVHAAGKHVAVIAIRRDHLVALRLSHLQTDNDGFLPDIEMAETADEAHAIKLAGFLLEAADEQHVAVGAQFLLAGKSAVAELGPVRLGPFARDVG